MALSLVLLLLTGALATPVSHFRRQLGQTHEYPDPAVHGPEPLEAWVATYDAAVAAGLIPQVDPSTQAAGANPVYAAGVDTTASGLCSWTVSQCYGEGDYADVIDAPAGRFGVSLDDGPTPSSPALYDFLEAHNQSATHFIIGGNALRYPAILQQAVRAGGHLAIHTWSHPYMTTMTDHEILGELGWTVQIIYDMTGLIPAFWRPPYGDVDNRVRAIAKEVFGLQQTTLWNHDLFDWMLNDDNTSIATTQGPADDAALDADINAVLTGPKAPGVIWLQHERTNRSVSGFTRNYANILANGWDARNIPDLFGIDWYLNAARQRPRAAATSMSVGAGLVVASAGARTVPTAAPSTLSAILPTPTEAVAPAEATDDGVEDAA